MGWISDLASLPAVVAILVVFTACLWFVLKTVSKQIVDPFKTVITNHLEHDLEDREEDREERKEERTERKLERQTIGTLINKIDEFIGR